MNLQTHVIIINGVDKTYQVESIRLDGYKYAIKFHISEKVYSYSKYNVLWLTNPISIHLDNCHIFIFGKKDGNVKAVNLFTHNETTAAAVYLNPSQGNSIILNSLSTHYNLA